MYVAHLCMHYFRSARMAAPSLLARLAVLRVEAAAVAAVLGERDLLPEHAHELLHGGRVRAVAEDVLLGDLAAPLVEQAELVGVDEDVLVVVDDELGGLGAEDGRELVDDQLGRHVLRHLHRGEALLDGAVGHEFVRRAGAQSGRQTVHALVATHLFNQ